MEAALTTGRFKDDLTGREFGELVVLGHSHNEGGYSFWFCRCKNCGKEKPIRRNALVNASGGSKSCGCRSQESLAANRKTHGCCSRDGATKEYRAWESMISRCERTTGKSVKSYRSKGVTVCQRWRESFENFLADMGHSPTEEHTVDRRDNDGNYEPGNCRWATRKEQMRNTSKNHPVTIAGVTKTLVEWVEERGLKYNTILYRLKRGWPAEQALGFQDGT